MYVCRGHNFANAFTSLDFFNLTYGVHPLSEELHAYVSKYWYITHL